MAHTLKHVTDVFLQPTGRAGSDNVIERLIGHAVDHEHVHGECQERCQKEILRANRFVFEVLLDGFFENEEGAQDGEHRRGEHSQDFETSGAVRERGDGLRGNEQGGGVLLAAVMLTRALDLLAHFRIVAFGDPGG